MRYVSSTGGCTTAGVTEYCSQSDYITESKFRFLCSGSLRCQRARLPWTQLGAHKLALMRMEEPGPPDEPPPALDLFSLRLH